MNILYCKYTLFIFGMTALMVQELWHMEYFFPMPSGISLTWILLSLEHHRERSGNGFSSWKNFLGRFNAMLTCSFSWKNEDYF